MNLAPVVNRLRESLPQLRYVGGAADLAKAEARATGWPCAFVLPAAEQGSAIELVNATAQRIAAEFDVYIAGESLTDTEGVASVESVEEVREAIRGALLGYQISDAFAPIEFAAGQLVDIAGAVVWWIDTYRTEYFVRAT